jgi:uncharacterized protein YcbX
MDIRLSAIHLYPVKSIRGIVASRAELEPDGLRHDRRWVIVDDQGKFISQRTHPDLALITGSFDGNRLALSAPGRNPLELEVPDGNRRIDVTVWRDHLDAAAADPRADRWLSDFLDHPCRLAFMDEACRRPISSAGGRPGETVSFADGYPCLLISTASLADLNARLADPLPMDRFRPNLVVTGCEAYAEDGWRKIAIGQTVFRFAGLCPRCSVTTVDQTSGLRSSEEPLRTLVTYRQRESGVVFGVNLVPEQTGEITVGDQVTVLA